MTSKKPANSKRTSPPKTSDYTKTFLKDWERLSRSGRYDLRRLKEAMLLLIANDAPLAPSGWTIRSKANGLTTVNAISGVTSC